MSEHPPGRTSVILPLVALGISMFALLVSIASSYDKIRPSTRISAVLNDPPVSLARHLNDAEFLFMNSGSTPAVIESIEIHGQRADRLPDSDTDTFSASPIDFSPIILLPGTVSQVKVSFGYYPGEEEKYETLRQSVGTRSTVAITMISPITGLETHEVDYIYEQHYQKGERRSIPPGYTEYGGGMDSFGNTHSKALGDVWSKRAPISVIDQTTWFWSY